MARTIDAEVDEMFKQHFARQRKQVAGGALAGLANVLSTKAGLKGGYTAQRFFPSRQALSPKEALMLRAQVVRDMGNYVKSLYGAEVGSFRRLRRQGSAANSFADFLERVVGSSGSANQGVVTAQINAMRDLAGDMTKGIDALYPKYQANMVNTTYLRLREQVLGTSEDGTLLNESGVSQLARRLAGDQLLRANPQMLSDVFYLLDMEVRSNDAYGGRSLTDILEQYAAADNKAAATLLSAVNEARRTAQDTGARLIRARAKMLGDMSNRILEMSAGPDMEQVKAAADVWRGLMKGEGNLQQLDGAVQQATEKAVDKPTARPMESYQRLLNQLEGGQLPNTRAQIMASEGYRNLVDRVNTAMEAQHAADYETRTGRPWQPLDPDDPSTFSLINRMRKRENRDRRKNAREQIRFAEFGSDDPEPSTGAQAVGGGLGYEAERGDASSPGRDLVADSGKVRVTRGPEGIEHRREPMTMERLLRTDLSPPVGEPAEVPSLEEGYEALMDDGTPAVWKGGQWDTAGPEAQALGASLQEVWELDPEVGKTQLARFQKNWLDAQNIAGQQARVTDAAEQIGAATPVEAPAAPPSMSPEEQKIIDLTKPGRGLTDYLRKRLRRRERNGGPGTGARP